MPGGLTGTLTPILMFRLLNAVTAEERSAVLRDQTAHYDFVNGERDGYYLRREEAMYQKNNILSTIEDSMDQSTTDTPHYKQGKTKSLHRTLGTKLCGLRYHGHGTFFYVTFGQCQITSSHTIHCSNESLKCMQEHYKQLGTSWPRVWYLQLDSAGDNKNCWMLGYLGWLIERGVFDRIEVHFLVVGHTHEDIDQLFSVISKALYQVDVLTVAHLCELIRSSFSCEGFVKVVELWGIPDFKVRLVPCLLYCQFLISRVPNFHDHLSRHGLLATMMPALPSTPHVRRLTQEI